MAPGSPAPCAGVAEAQPSPLNRGTVTARDQGARGPAAGAGTGQPAGRQDLPSSPARVTGRAHGRHFHFLALEKAPPSSGTSGNPAVWALPALADTHQRCLMPSTVAAPLSFLIEGQLRLGPGVVDSALDLS
ncbi:hypothetical protein H8959_007352 [Pygathrix nigripes]